MRWRALWVALLCGPVAIGCSDHANGENDAAEQGATSEATWRGPEKLGIDPRFSKFGDMALVSPPGVPEETRFRNAYWSARLAALSYENQSDVRSTLKRWGAAGSVRWFFNRRTDTVAFFYEGPSFNVVSFRGTDSFGDWLMNLRGWMVDTPYGRVHSGFHAAFRSVWDDDAPGLFTADVDGTPVRGGLHSFAERSVAAKKPLLLTGHSLGGALATIAGRYVTASACPQQSSRDRRICSLNTDIGLYTFGAPRVGNPAFVRYDGGHIVRAANDGDVVARLPELDAKAVGRATRETWYNRDLYVHPNEHQPCFLTSAMLVDCSGQSREYHQQRWQDVWRSFAGEHSSSEYVRRLAAQLSGPKFTPSIRRELATAFDSMPPSAVQLVSKDDLHGQAAIDLTLLEAESDDPITISRWASPIGAVYIIAQRTTYVPQANGCVDYRLYGAGFYPIAIRTNCRVGDSSWYWLDG